MSNNHATAEAVAAPKTKRDRVAQLHYITRGAQNVKDANFEVSQMNVYCSLGFTILYYTRCPKRQGREFRSVTDESLL